MSIHTTRLKWMHVRTTCSMMTSKWLPKWCSGSQEWLQRTLWTPTNICTLVTRFFLSFLSSFFLLFPSFSFLSNSLLFFGCIYIVREEEKALTCGFWVSYLGNPMPPVNPPITRMFKLWVQVGYLENSQEYRLASQDEANLRVWVPWPAGCNLLSSLVNNDLVKKGSNFASIILP